MNPLTAKLDRRLLAKLTAAGATITGFSLGASRDVAGQDSPTVILWLDVTGGSDGAQWMIDNTVAEFNALGGVQVEATMQPNGWTATQTALAGGAGPDVVVTPGPSLSMELGKAGQIIALDDYAAEFGWADSFAPWAMDLGRVNDALIALPNEVETLVLYYNKPCSRIRAGRRQRPSTR